MYRVFEDLFLFKNKNPPNLKNKKIVLKKISEDFEEFKQII